MHYEEQIKIKKERIKDLSIDIYKLEKELPQLNKQCEYHFNCSDCTKDVNCGWCSFESKCVIGEPEGPKHVACDFYDYNICRGK